MANLNKKLNIVSEYVLCGASSPPPTPGLARQFSFKYQESDENINYLPTGNKQEKEETFSFSSLVKSKINYHLLPYKLFYFFTDGAMACVVPFRSLYFKQLGLTAGRIGIVSATKPFVCCLANPLAALLADRLEMRRLTMVLCMAMWILGMLGLGIFPPKTLKQSDCMKAKEQWDDILSDPKCHLEDDDGHPLSNNKTCTDHLTLNAKNYCLLENQSWRYDQKSLQGTFVVIISITLITYFAFGPAIYLGDTSTLAEIARDKSKKDMADYGWHRSFGGLGMALFAPVVGFLLTKCASCDDVCGIEVLTTEYFFAFAAFGGIAAIAFLSTFWMNFEQVKRQSWDTQWAELRQIFLSMHYGSVLFVAFVVGFCNGGSWGFFLWHVENLDADKLLIGVLEALQSSSQLVMGFFMELILHKFGPIFITCVGLIMYSIRFVFYAYITNPYWMIPVEILHGVSFIMTWSTFVSCLASAVSPSCLTIAQGLLGAVYFGLGSGFGSLVSGFVIDEFGAKMLFSGFAGVCMAALMLFISLQYISSRSKKLAFQTPPFSS